MIRNPSTWIDAFSPAKGPLPGTLMAFLIWAFRGSFRFMALGGFVSVIAGVLEVLTALILGRLIDVALATSPDSFFGSNSAMLLGVVVFFLILRPLVFGLSGMMNSVVVAPPIVIMAMARMHRYTLGQSVDFFDNDFAGRIAQKMGQAARAGAELFIEFIHTVVFATASLVASIVLMLSIDGRTGALLAGWTVCYVFLIRFFIPKVRVASKARAASRAMVTGQIVDTVTNVKTVKLFAHDKFEDQTALEAMEEMRLTAVKFGWISASFRFCLMTLAGMLPLIIVGATLYFWVNGTATAGDIVAAGSVSLRLAQMTGWVSFTLLGMYANVGEVEDAIRTLSPAHSLVDAPDASQLSVSDARIEFSDVTFTYGGGPGGVESVGLTIHPGEKLGVVGASGAGKSTLVSLLLRMYDAEQGEVLIDGQNVSRVTQESLRRQIGMVTQETAMFNRSARDNIAYGRPNATNAEIDAAARKAEAYDFIQTLADFKGRQGYEAYLGERGVKLSGGQRQRIAIARAILKDAPILVLDEATSALDSEVEASIQAALETVMEGKTVIAIAHRLSTLSRMDRIIVLDAGKIVEQGTHADLLAQDGLYARYWNRQSGGFITVEDAAE